MFALLIFHAVGNVTQESPVKSEHPPLQSITSYQKFGRMISMNTFLNSGLVDYLQLIQRSNAITLYPIILPAFHEGIKYIQTVKSLIKRVNNTEFFGVTKSKLTWDHHISYIPREDGITGRLKYNYP